MKIRGIASTRQVFVDGVELLPDRSQGYLNLSPGGFAWGDEGSGSAQLALAILLVHYGAPINAIDEYENFNEKFIAPLAMDKDFDIEIHTWKPGSPN